MLAVGLMGSAVAQADGGDGQQRREPQHSQAQPAARGENRQAENRQADPRQFDNRSGTYDNRSFEARAEEQRRAMQDAAHNAEMSRRAGRMTPDERRDLRRQINEVGQDLYANPPRR